MDSTFTCDMICRRPFLTMPPGALLVSFPSRSQCPLRFHDQRCHSLLFLSQRHIFVLFLACAKNVFFLVYYNNLADSWRFFFLSYPSVQRVWFRNVVLRSLAYKDPFEMLSSASGLHTPLEDCPPKEVILRRWMYPGRLRFLLSWCRTNPVPEVDL